MRKLTGVSVLILFVLVQAALAAISVDTSGSFTDGSSATTHTLSFTVANQANRILVTTNGTDGNSLGGTFTFNGDALTLVTGAEVASGASALAAIHYRIAPDVATGNLVYDNSINGAVRAGICALSLYGADQSSPITDSDETSGTTETSGTLTLTTVAGDYVVYGIQVRGNDPDGLTHTAGSATGEVEIADLVINSVTNAHGCSYVVASGSSTQVGYSWTSSTGWALVAVVVTPATSTATGGSFLSRRRK